MWRRRSPSVMMPTSLPSAPVMPMQPKPFAVMTMSASDIAAPSGASGTVEPVCMKSLTVFNNAPSLPPGCSMPKSTAVKP